MKSTLLAVTFLFFCTAILAQDSTIQRSRFEEFSSRGGTVYQTNHQQIGTVSKVGIELYRTIKIETGDSVKAVRIRGTFEGDSPRFSGLFIDTDEVDTIITLLNTFKEIVRKDQHQNEPVFTFITAYDVLIECYYDRSFLSRSWNVKIGKIYKHLRTPVNSGILFRDNEFPELLELLKKSTQAKFGR